jgi:segregation and condensation protein B
MPSQSAAAPDPLDDSPESPEVLPAEGLSERRGEATWEYARGEGRGVNLSLPARLEAILYLKGRPLSLGELAEIAAVGRDQAEMALITLMADYAHRDTALEIHQDGQRYSLQLRESLGDLVQDLLPIDLSTAALRTLATIALKKRILQSDLVELRGSGAYDHIKELLAQGFIERKRQSEGRSSWLTLSEKFHRTFSVRPEDLPSGRRPRGGPETLALDLDLEIGDLEIGEQAA